MDVHVTGSEAIKRLESDLRTFSPAGIERVAWGWVQHEVDPAQLHEAEKMALRQIEKTDRGEEWDSLRLALRDLMEGSNSLLSWKEERGHEGHTAERAVYAAALALMTGDQLPHAEYVVLVRPLAEALPWLLPETPPTPRPRASTDLPGTG
jgi:hypothetical protein